MKIQCNACEAAEAKVMCCADEAALCWDCDERVHAANKLAGKHQRVLLLPASASSPSPSVPKCDICQEASGYFFCLEDRALLCRNCDVSIHTANPYVSAHRRFLLTGVRVALEHAEPVPSVVGKEQPNSTGSRAVEPSPKPSPNKCSLPLSGESNEVYSGQVSKDGNLSPNKPPFCGGAIPDWPLDDLFGFSDFNFNQSYGFTEHGSSKADSGRLGSSEGSPPCFPAEEGLDFDGCFSQVPVVPSPPTASGLHWQRNLHYHTVDHAASVPDICSSYDFHENQPYPKRRRPS
ncbi:B-box zinc finger protein 22-like [Iris pallida]|uniref:B-box zinc finger protein 22-like n=1 Tax=Iris pallida TaxID=29817 RepID=A0AAX6HSV4_IRIPA|nr:B-box zinc finger protein 22-like [Iris pallida]